MNSRNALMREVLMFPADCSRAHRYFLDINVQQILRS